MSVNENIRDKKLQYNINKDAAKISELSSGKSINMKILHLKKYYLMIKVE